MHRGSFIAQNAEIRYTVSVRKIEYNSPAALKEFLCANGLGMQKKFGQNFLINESARKKIVAALELGAGARVWEVGPGLGCMTCELLETGAHVTAFEIDRGFISALKDFFSAEIERGNFALVEGDVLKNWRSAYEERAPQFLFGNLPYNIAASFIAQTIERGARFERCAFTVQKEVAQRMEARPTEKDYSSFSVLCQWAYDVKTLCDLGRANFWPRPNVDSRSILFVKKAEFPRCKNPAFFVKLQRALFSNRRKTVKNNLQAFLRSCDFKGNAEEILRAANIKENARAEELCVEELLHLSDFANDAIL